MLLKERAADITVQTEGEVVIDGSDPLLEVFYGRERAMTIGVFILTHLYTHAHVHIFQVPIYRRQILACIIKHMVM